MTHAGHPVQEKDTLRFGRRFRAALAAVVVGASVLCLSPGTAVAAKEKFVRSKPHVNVGTLSMMNETLTLRVELVDTVERATGTPTGIPCNGVVDMLVEEAGSGSVLASRSDVALSPGTIESLNHTVTSAPALVRVVIVADDMRVDGVTCAFRGQIEIVDLADGRVRRSIPIRREDFVAVTKLR